MTKILKKFTTLALCTSFIIFSSASLANPQKIHGRLSSTPMDDKPLVTPSPPNINAKAYILIDTNSGKILAEKDSDKELPPASLTKMMTLYVISKALDDGQINLTDKVRISEKAWKTGGSRMFVKEGESVSVENLLKGIIVDSGNDACVAMAEYLGGSEKAFASIMNQEAKRLGMNNSSFTDSTGLPNKELYSTAKDLAVLGRALVNNFPQYYHWYKQKWFTYNGIRQPNRNRLLWRDTQVDGIKTGHTDNAGYCLVSSAKKDNMRLIAVVLGSPTETLRADDSERLLNWGFRFYDTHKIYDKEKEISSVQVYKGKGDSVTVGLKKDQFITIPNGQYKRVSVKAEVPANLVAPIKTGDKVGDLVVRFDENIIVTQPLYALNEVKEGGFFTRMKDGIKLTFKSWFGD